jgi:hypothetical protein
VPNQWRFGSTIATAERKREHTMPIKKQPPTPETQPPTEGVSMPSVERIQQELGSAKSLDDRLRASRASLSACLPTPSSRCLRPS